MELIELIILSVFLVILGLVAFRFFGGAGGKFQANSATGKGSLGQFEQFASPAGYEIYEIAVGLDSFFNVVAHPAELLSFPAFKDGVALFCGETFSPQEINRFAVGDHIPISCMALQAMRERNDTAGLKDEILFGIGTFAPYQHYFALRYLTETTPSDEPIIGKVLGATTNYMSNRLSRSDLEEFLRHRQVSGEAYYLNEDEISFLNDEGMSVLRRFLSEIEPDLGKPLLECIELDHGFGNAPVALPPPSDAHDEHDEPNILETTGRLWTKIDAKSAENLVLHADIEKTVAELKTSLTAKRPQSALLTGESGVGKTAIQRIVARQLFKKGWTIFVAGHSDLLAGQTYIGQLEQRLKKIVEKLRSTDKIIWHIPNIDQLVFTGTHQYSNFSALDAILPYVEDGSLRIMADAQPSAYDRLVQVQPRIANAMAVRPVNAASRDITLKIADQWLKSGGYNGQDDLLAQTWDMAQQYLGGRQAPGNVMDMLMATTVRLSGSAGGKNPIVSVEDMILTLSQQTGLPPDLLDTQRGLDLDDLEASLTSCVIGQDEAVKCLVDRVAMIKAGISDPTRPYGVFLFAGPTGTGKTEIAKALATWLFGSVDRLIRIDMSELQTAESLSRLIGSSDNTPGESLADQVRKQPFSVILLDEFEKSHPNVWDLFLQVFDDGRITDRRGRTASFKHSIIILTANLGATIPTGQSIGFSSGSRRFDVEEVNKAVETAFRREFINRLDRVVVFHPLSRELMRQILHRELGEALNRRGLKGRPWAMEWDESAIAFLLEKGFTPDLGARPLRRAIEQYLLSPLAATIVRHQFPEGDQFLFISCSGNNLQVEFVDPELDEETDGSTSDGEPTGAARDGFDGARAILLQPTGSKSEIAGLSALLSELGSQIGSPDWREKKNGLFARMERFDFWSSPDRFKVLGLLETIDRVEKGLERAHGLYGRLQGQAAKKKLSTRLIAMLAQSVYLLKVASDDIFNDNPREAFLSVEVRNEGRPDAAGAVAFGHQIADMYEAWAKKRNMRLTRLIRTDVRNEVEMRAIYSVTGYGAYSILAGENGQHVRERSENASKSGQSAKSPRISVNVTVVAQPDMPLPSSPVAASDFAKKALDGIAKKSGGKKASANKASTNIVRRYREGPSPLVRDANSGWRTGRIDLVLGGNFDLF